MWCLIGERLLLQYFREKIRAEAEGKSYSVPPPSTSNAGSRLPPTGGMAARSGSSQSLSGRVAANKSNNNDDWDDWGDKKVTAALQKKGGAARHIVLQWLDSAG